MNIPAGKAFTETRLALEVIYHPKFSDGTKGHRQTCYLPWEGSRAISQPDLIMAVRRYFAALDDIAGQNDVVGVRLFDRREGAH
jgi:hypothetical protein